MIVDNTLVFSDSQAITADAASTNIIDLGAAGTAFGHAAALGRDVGKGVDIPVYVTITEAFNTLTSLTISIQVDDSAGFGSAVTVATGPAMPLASLTLGAQMTFPARLPEGTNKRYVRLYYDVTGTNPTLGKVFAAIVAARQNNP